MFNIYCLISPYDKTPFYVGVTVSKIHNRLSQHIGECKWIKSNLHGNEKQRFILSMLKKGDRPKVRILKVVDLYEVDFYEYFFYDMFKKQGFNLMQTTPCFIYIKKYTTDKNKFLSSKSLNNNSLIIKCNNVAKIIR